MSLLFGLVCCAMLIFRLPSVESQACGDLRTADQCYRWYLLGHCHYGQHVALMLRICRHTCGMCGVPQDRNTMTTAATSTTDRRPLGNGLATCSNSNSYCDTYQKLGYCKDGNTFQTFMKNNCKKACGFCKTTGGSTCQDKTNACNTYVSHCKAGSTYFDYMKTNCQATCNFCNGGQATTVRPGVVTTRPMVTSQPSGTAEFTCNFDSSLCHWENEHFDDTVDWKSGRPSIGGPKPYNGPGCLYLDSPYSTGMGRVYLPWNLVLPANSGSRGDTCMRFMYKMSAGVLKVSTLPNLTETNKQPSPRVVFSTTKPTSGWQKANVLISVDADSTVVIEGTMGKTAGHVFIDEMAFYRGRC